MFERVLATTSISAITTIVARALLNGILGDLRLVVLLIALLGITVVVASIIGLRLHPILGLVLGTLTILLLADAVPGQSIAGRLSSGMAEIFQKIGLPIVFASMVGGCLLDSGAATRIVQSIVGLFGAGRIAPALSISGFLMAVPVYFDTVFYLLLPLAKAVAKDRPSQYLMSVMAIIVGATMAHSLVPPTPGPLLVANRLGISIGTMMLGGTIVGGIASTFGFWYGKWCSQQFTLTLASDSISTKDSASEIPRRGLPPLWLSLLPLLVPLGMIAAAETFVGGKTMERSVFWQCVGDPVFALLAAAILAFILMRRVASQATTQIVLSKAVSDAGVILLLTCAGGGFGVALNQLGVGSAIVEQFPSFRTSTGLLFMAFATTALIRAAQGSATVAMTTTVEIIRPLMDQVELAYHPIYIALAIGCGSKLFAWMNDSGFWQVASMTGMSTSQTLKTFSAALTLMGIVGFTVVLFGAFLLPFRS